MKSSLSSVKRLNYIGSKFQLLEWLRETIFEQTGWASFKDKHIADLFAGTGVVSLMFASEGATMISNDAEKYSSTIVSAMIQSSYTDRCKKMIQTINEKIGVVERCSPGFITRHYSPFERCTRQFFSVENARRIDEVREMLSNAYAKTREINEAEYKFLVASLIVSADAVSNVPAVYGSYLKKFKAKALKPFVLIPVNANSIKSEHTSKSERKESEHASNNPHEVYSSEIHLVAKEMKEVDLVYLDPPYNERNYSANYFPLNLIAQTPEETMKYAELKGVTGIPPDCFRSGFCKKTKVEESFRELFRDLAKKTKWIVLSYNSESLINRERMLQLIKEEIPSSRTRVVTRDYKRFKNFDYSNESKGSEANDTVIEYLYCIQTN